MFEALPLLKPEGVLEFRGHFGVLRLETVSTHWVLKPALVEYEEEISSGVESPAHAALPAEIA